MEAGLTFYNSKEPTIAEKGLSIFSSPEFGKVRVFMREGEPWFVASDVAKALKYANPSDAVNRLCKKAIKTTINGNPRDGNPPINVNIIPESDMFRLIMRSNAPKAEEFQAWVFEEILPTLRKTGSYSLVPASQQPREMTETNLAALRAFVTIDCKVTGVQATYALDRAWQKKFGESPLALTGIRLESAPDDDRAMYVTVTEIGKLYGKTAMKLNPILTSLGLQTCQEKKTKDGKKKYIYMPTELGVQHGGKRFSDSAKGDLQREVWNLFWHKEKLPAFLDEHLKRRDMEPEVVDTEIVSGVV